MSLIKKDFIALADAIRAFNGDYIGRASYKDSPDFSQDQIEALADFCAKSNPAFNRQRWMDYIEGKVGPNGGIRAVPRTVCSTALCD